MKRILSLVAFIMILATSVFAQSDTIVNNGDGKVVIIDKRPRTIIRKNPVPEKPQVTDVTNIQMPEQQTVVYYPVYENKPEDSTAQIILTLLGIGVIAWFILWYLQKNECNHCHCKHHNMPQPPVVNHFHVSGGNSVIDTSENYSNFQPDHSMHKHHHDHRTMPPILGMFFKSEKEKKKSAEEQQQ